MVLLLLFSVYIVSCGGFLSNLLLRHEKKVDTHKECQIVFLVYIVSQMLSGSIMMTVQFSWLQSNFYSFCITQIDEFFLVQCFFANINNIIKVGDSQKKSKSTKMYKELSNRSNFCPSAVCEILRSIVHRFQRRSNFCQSFIIFFWVIHTPLLLDFIFIKGTKLIYITWYSWVKRSFCNINLFFI